MTCVWDGILRSLRDEDFETFEGPIPRTPRQLIRFFKGHNRVVTDIAWNGKEITPRNAAENVVHISNIELEDGYLCSSCEPLMFLLCSLFRVNVHHDYCNTRMTYETPQARTTLHYRNGRRHFVFVSRTDDSSSRSSSSKKRTGMTYATIRRVFRNISNSRRRRPRPLPKE